jgi:hypothetical protein
MIWSQILVPDGCSKTLVLAIDRQTRLLSLAPSRNTAIVLALPSGPKKVADKLCPCQFSPVI